MTSSISSATRLPTPQVSDRWEINLSWIITLRWVAAVGQTLTILVVGLALSIPLAWRPLAVIIGIELASNALLAVWHRHRAQLLPEPDPAALERQLCLVMLLDLLLLTALLYYTGGEFNPFSSFYLINVALAAVVLRPAYAWLIAVAAFVCYSGLFLWHEPLEPIERLVQHALRVEQAEAMPRRGIGPLALALTGLWVGFAGSVVVIVYFITRLTGELQRREAQLAAAQQREAHTQKIDALATLAAGAAHELATPLATIAVAARELELALAAQPDDSLALGDAQLIRQQVDRCRGILDLMSAESSRSSQDHQTIEAEQLVRTALSDWPGAERVQIAANTPGAMTVLVPLDEVAQSLRAVVQNALDASPDGQPVTVTLSRVDGQLEIRIADRGAGMPADVLARAGNPFFTTKDPGKGMGMGLFLARTVCQRLGGELTIASKSGEGTTVTLQLPLAGQ
ncbi:MAG: ATP-binding protein [Pirellulales bacterium]